LAEGNMEHSVLSPGCYSTLVSVGVQELVDFSDHRPLSALFMYEGREVDLRSPAGIPRSQPEADTVLHKRGRSGRNCSILITPRLTLTVHQLKAHWAIARKRKS
jgi:hypothetical protein